MSFRSFMPLSASFLAAVILVAVPKEAGSAEPKLLQNDATLQNEGGLQYTEDGYGNPNCGGRCGGRPCCSIIIQ
jgi:hypothetical protein